MLCRATLIALLFAITSCEGSDGPECVSSADCPTGRCVDGTCVDGPGDTGTASDTGPTDTGTASDTGTPTDTGTASDTGTPTDTGTASDTGTPTDTGTVSDTGTPVDGSATTYTLTVRASGTGRIHVITSDPPGIDCRSDLCSADFPAGTVVTLTQLPEDCPWLAPASCSSSPSPCVVTMDSDQTVRAFFPRDSGGLCP